MATQILIIEDNPANLELMRYLLMSQGCEIVTATDGRQGMEILTVNLPDLVICDVQMPVMNGFEVAKSMKGNSSISHIPLIAVTALAMDLDKKAVLAAGFDGYITKPITPETFVAEVLFFLKPVYQSEEQ